MKVLAPLTKPAARSSGRTSVEVLEFAHRLLADALRSGGVGVDATAGNGHDTLHLAHCAGVDGHVIGFDVQEVALRNTQERLAAAGVEKRVTLIQAGHERMNEVVPAVLAGRVDASGARVSAVCFNLGYLPGGDKSLITRPETTIPAVRAAADLLAPQGVLTIVCYSGHPGGADERDAVLAWARKLSPTPLHTLDAFTFQARARWRKS